jgi:hypothetical protein
MAQDELLDLIRKEVAQKKSRETIVSNLIFAGWKYREIERGFADLFRKGEVSKEFLRESTSPAARSPLQDQAHRIEESVGSLDHPRTKFEIASELIDAYKQKMVMWSAGIITVIAAVGVGYAIYSNLSSVIVGRALQIGMNASSFTYRVTAQGPVDINYQDTDIFKRTILPVSQAIFSIDGSFVRASSNVSALSYAISVRGSQDSGQRWQANIILPGSGGAFVQVNSIMASSTLWQAALGRIAQRWIGMASTDDLLRVPFAGPRGLWNDIFLCRSALGGRNGNLFSFLKQPGVITGIRRVGVEQKDGVPAYHFVLTLSGAAASQADPSVAACVGAQGFTHWGAVLNGSWDFFVNKKTREPLSLNRSDIVQSGAGVTVGLSTLSMDFDHWNQPLSIGSPQSFLSAQQAENIITDTGPARATSTSGAPKK